MNTLAAVLDRLRSGLKPAYDSIKGVINPTEIVHVIYAAAMAGSITSGPALVAIILGDPDVFTQAAYAAFPPLASLLTFAVDYLRRKYLHGVTPGPKP